MNIGELLHNVQSPQTISHWPSYTVGQHKKSWYFYSSKGVTLRKKIENTSLDSFLQLNNNDDNGNDDSPMILEVNEVDCRQPKSGQLYQIKITKTTPKQALHSHSHSPSPSPQSPNCQQTFYKISQPSCNKLYTLNWHENIITCQAPINSYHRQKLSKYAELVCRKAEEKYLRGMLAVKGFQLVFTYDRGNGRLRVVLGQNFVLGVVGDGVGGDGEFRNIRDMFRTNFRTGRDQHQYIQLLMQQQKAKLPQQLTMPQPNIPPYFSQPHQKAHLQYLNLLQKLQKNPIKISLKKQNPPTYQSQQFQCACCHSLVILSQFQHKKMISSHRVERVQIARQVKMRDKGNFGDYDMVGVCDLCYGKFREIVRLEEKELGRNGKDGTEGFMKNRVFSVKQRKLNQPLNQTKQEDQNRVSISSTDKDIVKIPYIKSNFVKCSENFTTKTNTTTIRHQLNNSKQKGKLQCFLDSQVPHKPRKSSLCIQKKQQPYPTTTPQIPISQKTLLPHKSSHLVQKQPIQAAKHEKCHSIDFETDDELTQAVAEYEQLGNLNQNKNKIRNMRNMGRSRRREV